MNRVAVVIGIVAALALPAAVAAKPPVEKEHRQAAHAQCKTERGSTKATHGAFKARYHSMNRCVRQNAAEEAAEEAAALKNASKECADERKMDRDAFAEKYGTNRNNRNAFGKCVSTKAKEKKAEMDADDAEEVAEFKNAAKECADERKMDGDAFVEKYGTNENNRNAFGKCVSKKAKGDA
jgi:hypothetical protein